MHRIHVNALSGNFLNYAVAACEYGDDWDHEARVINITEPNDDGVVYQPAFNWKQGGPIIEENKINIRYYEDLEPPEMHEPWDAYHTEYGDPSGGETALIAAMRAYVAMHCTHLELTDEEYEDLL